MRLAPAALTLTLAAACVAPTTTDPSSGDRPDASIKTPDAATVQCTPAAPSPGDGHHNAGANCLGCHTGGGVPKWTAAGTLYDTAGTTAIAGATITLTDATGKSVTIVSAQNGNFWTSTALQMPLQVRASKCPTTVQMSGQAQGSCNGCHFTGGSPGRIKLP